MEVRIFLLGLFIEICVGSHLQQDKWPPHSHPGPTLSGFQGQEILAADSADHSAAQQTDTTLCPNQEGAE